MEQDGKLGFYEIDDNTAESDIIQKVNTMTEGHNVWRLLIFEGANKIQRQDNAKISDGCVTLLRYYAQNNSPCIPVKCRCYPEDIWYLEWVDKQDIIRLEYKVFKGLPTDLVYKVYSFCMIASLDSENARRYSEFMACCDLLILALNHFPIGFLSPLCLYFVETEIDRKIFAEYVNRQYGNIIEIEKLLALESQRLQEQRQKGIPCPQYPKIAIGELKQEDPPELDRLKQRIVWQKTEGNIEYALNQNAYEIRKWMHYPRGVMSGVVDRLEEELDKEQLAGGFLSVAGKDMLKRQLENALEKLSIAHKEVMEQTDFEYELRKRENSIRKRIHRKLAIKQKAIIFLLAFLTEVPFLYFTFNMLHPFTSDGNMGGVGRICLITVSVTIVVAIMLLMPVVSFWYERHLYIHFLKEQMKDKAERKRKYLQNTLELVAEYQYYVRLDREQQRLEQEWEMRNKNLRNHLSIWQQSNTTKMQLRYLLDKDEQEDILDAKVNIDFGEEPQEISYYWMAYKDNCFKAELNDSGYMMEAALEFITRFRCVENPAKVTVLHES